MMCESHVGLRPISLATDATTIGSTAAVGDTGKEARLNDLGD